MHRGTFYPSRVRRFSVPTFDEPTHRPEHAVLCRTDDEETPGGVDAIHGSATLLLGNRLARTRLDNQVKIKRSNGSMFRNDTDYCLGRE